MQAKHDSTACLLCSCSVACMQHAAAVACHSLLACWPAGEVASQGLTQALQSAVVNETLKLCLCWHAFGRPKSGWHGHTCTQRR